ncbi:MAG: C39 family peptidase [Oscillospiraceae bacterium]|nr:C39 family peptidase [Oscillospiraceae bacterium]
MQLKKLPNMDKNKLAIIVSAGATVLAAIVGISGFFAARHGEPTVVPDTTAEIISTSELVTETETTTEPETETETETDTETETATETTTKPPAAPVTKPYTPPTTAPAPKPTSTAKSVRLNVTPIKQFPNYPTGCEAASAATLLKYYGYNVSLDEMVAAIPREDLYEENGRVYGPSIYEKFVGDPRQRYTDERPGYGAFSPVITKSLNSVIAKKGGKHTAKNITGCSFSTLLGQLDSGRPVIVWATSKMQTPKYVNSWYIKNPGGEDIYFEYPRGTHVMVLTGYDGSYVYISDPIYGQVKYTKAEFNDKWVLLGKQAIILENKPQETTTESTTAAPTTTEPTTEPVTEPTTEPVTEPTTEEITTDTPTENPSEDTDE